MKFLLVFALCGVACCLEGPSCSSDELRKCYSFPVKHFPLPPFPVPPFPVESEDIELARICRENKCFLETYERCGSEGFTDRPFPVKNYRRVVNAFCGRPNPLIKKYLENIKCLRSATNDENTKKIEKMCDIVATPIEEFCRKIAEEHKCAVDYIAEECGKDAGDVFQVVILPYLDPHDCLSSSHTYDF